MYIPKTKRKRKNGADLLQESAKQEHFSQNKKSKQCQRQPTVQEINQLKETNNLYHSNLFRLQIEQMLVELKVSDTYTQFIADWIDKLKQFLRDLPTEKFNTDSIPWLKNSQIETPAFFEMFKWKMFEVEFNRPKNEPFVVGSADTTTFVGHSYVVDICVEIPQEYLLKTDFLNLKYDYKRLLYLTYVASKMAKSKNLGEIDVNFNYFANNPLKPVLEIKTKTEHVTEKVIFRLFLVPEENTFKLNRFVPWNSNIRSSIFTVSDKNDDDNAPFATPNYNANALFDLTIKTNNKFINECLRGNKNFQQALILLKVWLYQRRLNIGFSGFQGYIMSALIVYLYKQRKLYANMSSYQVTKNVWNFLASSSWDETNKGISLFDQNLLDSKQPTLEQFHTYYDVVFVDSTGYLNICANLCRDVYQRVRFESKIAIDMLNERQSNDFDILFLKEHPVYTQFDHIFSISKSDVIAKILKKYGKESDKHNYAGNSYPQVLHILSRILQKGLEDRVLSLMPIEESSEAWPLNAKSIIPNENIRLGFILDPKKAFDIFTKGPQANEDATEEFRMFWGEKSELRRFIDGSILETCVWTSSSDSLVQKRQIVRYIIEHLLKHHFAISPADINYMANEMDAAYQLNKSFKLDKVKKNFDVSQYMDAETSSISVIKSFDDLGKKLRSLELPVEITMISGISPVFRYCDPIPCLPQARMLKDNMLSNHVHKGVIQLGTNSKWPSQLSALRALKIALCIKIANIIKEKYKYESKVTLDGLFILKDGFVFSLEIAHPKEVVLLKKEITENGVIKYIDNCDSIALQKRQIILPKVTYALHGLYQLHSSFGPSVMIAKRWLGAHLIDHDIWPEECTELLIAYQYLKSNKQRNPIQPQAGFLRFLHLLANVDWKSEMFLVNFNDEMKDHEISELENRFNTEREYFPPLFITTSYDQLNYGYLWSSKQTPDVHILARVTLLARHAIKTVEETVFSLKPTLSAFLIFKTTNHGYNYVIQLQPDAISNCMAKEFPSPFSPFTKPCFKLPLAGQNLIGQAVQNLREAFSNFCAFFYNPYGGKEIAVLWKPNVFLSKEFKVANVNGSSISKCGNKIHFDEDTLIDDFKIVLHNFYSMCKKV